MYRPPQRTAADMQRHCVNMNRALRFTYPAAGDWQPICNGTFRVSWLRRDQENVPQALPVAEHPLNTDGAVMVR